MAHELTHAILADEFACEELPLWADEGMAVLADPAAKQALHLRNFYHGVRRGWSWRLADFLSDESALSREQIPVFYGQSLSLVKFLVDRKTPADFVSFLHRTEKSDTTPRCAIATPWTASPIWSGNGGDL